MENSSINDIANWLQNSPFLSLLFVFLAALTESLAIIGLIVPGAIIMVLFGALVALDIVPFWPVVIAAILGAILGDGLSYWFGQRYKNNLRLFWPFARYPDLLDRGIIFFERHGGKSVVLGRFVGPLRAVIPLVAGMLNMPRSRFLFSNILSAIIWAPLYLLPGYLFGLSLEVASEFASRFLIVLLILVLVIWLVLFILRQIYLWLVPYLDYLLWRLVRWSQRHSITDELTTIIASPTHPEIRGLSIMTFTLLLAGSAFTFIHQAIVHLSFVNNLDRIINNGFHTLHNPPFNKLMAIFASLSDPRLVLIVLLISLIWLTWQRYWLASAYLMLATLFPLLTSIIPNINSNDEISWPVDTAAQLYDTPLIFIISVYGFLTIILAREIRASWRRLIYIAGAILMIMISFAQLYLGMELFSHITGQIALALLWLMIIGIAYRRHIASDKHSHHTRTIIILLPIMMASYTGIHYQQYLHLTDITNQNHIMSKIAWIESGWSSFPGYRDDLRGQADFPMNIQWAGDLDEINNALTAKGWSTPESGFSSLFQWLNASASLTQLPVLSQVHNGHYESLHMVKYFLSAKQIMIIRLWQSDTLIQNNAIEIPVWIGNVSTLVPTEYYGLHYLRTDKYFPNVNKSLGNISEFEFKLRRRERDMEGRIAETMLIYKNKQ